MSRDFDRFMVDLRNGSNFKLARLTHVQYRGLFSAVLPIAALSEVRGAFMVGGQPATVEDMMLMAPKLTAADCRSTLEALRRIGILEHDDDLGGEWVHDFEEWNPEPKRDPSNAQRQRRYRERQRAKRDGVTVTSRNGVTNGDVTPGGNGDVTPGEVEGKRREAPPLPPSGGRARDLAKYEQQLAAFAAEHFPGAHPKAVAFHAANLRRCRIEPTVEALRPLVEETQA